MVDLQLQRLNNRPLRGKAYVTDREIIRWISIGAVFLTLILAYAWLQTEVMHVHYQMEEFQKKNRQLHEINAALRAEHSSLMDPEKINRRARELGPHQLQPGRSPHSRVQCARPGLRKSDGRAGS